jgi:hypothetical protein
LTVDDLKASDIDGVALIQGFIEVLAPITMQGILLPFPALFRCRVMGNSSRHKVDHFKP